MDDNQTLYLNNDYTNDNLSDNGIIISKNIRIEGNGFTLNGLNESRIFTITNSSNLILNNINFINGYGFYGGAIYSDSFSNCTFTNLNFTNNFADMHGGAIYIEGDCISNKFINVTFKNNTALRGGAVYFNGNLIDNIMNIDASYNTVNIFSGAVFFVNGTTVNNRLNGKYINNSAPDHCGAVMYLKDNVTGNIIEGYFENNTCTNTGGVMTAMSTALNNTFKGSFYKNSARIGGVLYFYVPSYNNTIIGEFINNSATRYGSTIYFRGTPFNKITNSSFINNQIPSKNLNVNVSDSTLKVIMTGNDTVINAINAKNIGNLTFSNVTYWAENGLVNSDDVLPICNEGASGQNVTLEIYKNDEIVYNVTKVTNQTGFASFDYSSLNPGFYTYLIYHENNLYYTYINKTGNITVDDKIITHDLVKIYKNESKFEAFIGKVNETVSFKINGVTYNRTTDENGTAKLAINLNPGNYTIETIFNGTSVENNIEVLPTLIAQNLVKYFRNESQFLISLIDGEINPVANVNITMNINGVFYNRTTNENGTAKLNINLNPGEYILTAIDPLTGLMVSYNITVLPTLTADDLNMTYLDGSQFKAKLVDGQGKELENAGITFNINGVFYTRYTNSSGIAALNINLIPGEYIITSIYESAVTSNKITIFSKED
ncbi:hypothetical protein [uncultured Methanobrevibacter sp.]|uniref:hypothetical protein n=1 Tax=uncultured Methanobrevibacter sp. TaxID=253161 RepID=UPI0025D38F3C|nr:hypothetical protein [uncultured Methanobrevibacter sp.]